MNRRRAVVAKGGMNPLGTGQISTISSKRKNPLGTGQLSKISSRRAKPGKHSKHGPSDLSPIFVEFARAPAKRPDIRPAPDWACPLLGMRRSIDLRQNADSQGTTPIHRRAD
jgi:hypothetical protein